MSGPEGVKGEKLLTGRGFKTFFKKVKIIYGAMPVKTGIQIQGCRKEIWRWKSTHRLQPHRSFLAKAGLC
jgi:hypothetical protein